LYIFFAFFGGYNNKSFDLSVAPNVDDSAQLIDPFVGISNDSAISVFFCFFVNIKANEAKNELNIYATINPMVYELPTLRGRAILLA